MTVEELRAQILDSQFSANRYSVYALQMLNEAQNRVARRTDMRTFFEVAELTPVAGTPTVSLPNDFARLFSVEASEANQPLKALPIADFDQLPDDSSGLPTFYTVDRPDLRLWPTPDSEYDLQLRYYRTPVEMDDDSDTPELDENYHHILVTYALARCYRREHDLEQSQAHMAEFERELSELKADLQDDDQDATQPQQVGGLWHAHPDNAIRAFRP